MASSKPAERRYFTQRDAVLPLPNLIDHQRKSWQEFVETGLTEIFAEINPVNDYTEQKLELRFKSCHFEDPKMTDIEARHNNVSFEASLKAQVELTNKVTGEVKEQEIYLGDYPWMTERGTFVINGAERVVVSQLIRSAGVFFTATPGAGRNYYGAKVIPGRERTFPYPSMTIHASSAGCSRPTFCRSASYLPPYTARHASSPCSR